jgi:hypothetical protein
MDRQRIDKVLVTPRAPKKTELEEPDPATGI